MNILSTRIRTSKYQPVGELLIADMYKNSTEKQSISKYMLLCMFLTHKNFQIKWFALTFISSNMEAQCYGLCRKIK